MRARAAAVLAIAALVPAALLAWRARDVPHLGYFHDDSLYLASARSLAEGSGYRIPSLPGAPHQTKYPPLYPAALALAWRLRPEFPAGLPVALALTWAALPACVLFSRRVFARFEIPPDRAWLLAAAVAANPFLAIAGASLLSELPFTVLALAALLALDRRPLAAGLLAGAACLTRSAGVVVLFAGTMALRKRAGAFLAPGVAAAAGWWCWAQVHRTGADDPVSLYYTDYLGHYLDGLTPGDAGWFVYRNLDTLLLSAGGLFAFGLGDSFAAKSVARVLAVAAFAGLGRSARRGMTAFHWFAAAYLALLLVWNYPPDQRFLVPVLPVLAAGLYAEAANIWKTGRLARVLLAGCGLAGAALAAYAFAVVLPGFVEHQRALGAERRETYRWIARHTPGEARFLAYGDALLWLHTGRRACRMPIPPRLVYRSGASGAATALAGVAEVARRWGLTHALLTPVDMNLEFASGERGGAQAALAGALDLRCVYRSRSARVCEILSTIATDAKTPRAVLRRGGAGLARR